MTNLPETWLRVEIVEALEANNNGKPFQQGWSPQCETFPAPHEKWGVLKTTSIQNGEFWDDQHKCLPDHLHPRFHLEVNRHDVLITCAGPRARCGVVCLVEKTRPRLMMSGKMYRFRTQHEVMHPKFLVYFLQTPEAQLEIDRMKTGINDSGLNLTQGRFSVLRVPVAPFDEQSRIVAKIEELFSLLDKGVESLEMARAQLKVYRQAVLKQAFEGKLTAQWREENRDELETAEKLLASIGQERQAEYRRQLEDWDHSRRKWEQNGKKGKRPAKPRKQKNLQPFDIEELEKLPDISSASWKWTKIDKICSYAQYSIKAGPFGSALKKQFFVPDGYKIYGQEQVISGDPHFGDYFVDASKYEELSTCKIIPGDVLISLVGTVGKVLVLPNDCREGIINPRLIKISLNLKFYRPEFFKYFFESAFVRRLCQTLATGTTMDVLNLGIIQSLPFPLCSLLEQDKLIVEIESRLSVVDQVEEEIRAGLIRAEVLRQSILKNAFSGELVDQDSNDEPAAVILKRIKAKKASQVPRTRARKRKAANA